MADTGLTDEQKWDKLKDRVTFRMEQANRQRGSGRGLADIAENEGFYEAMYEILRFMNGLDTNG